MSNIQVFCVIGVVLFAGILYGFAAGEEKEVERSKSVQKAVIFRDADAAKVNQAVLNFLKTDPEITHVVQSESPLADDNPFCPSNKTAPKNLLTITIFYKEKQ